MYIHVQYSNSIARCVKLTEVMVKIIYNYTHTYGVYFKFIHKVIKFAKSQPSQIVNIPVKYIQSSCGQTTCQLYSYTNVQGIL